MEALYLILGWLPGLFTKRLEEAVQRPRIRRELRDAIFTELRELRGSLAVMAGQMAERTGEYDQALIAWSLPLLEEYRGPYAREILEALRQTENLRDERLKAASAALRMPGFGLHLKKTRAPFLDSSVGQLSIFSVESQPRALAILGRQRIFNQEVEAGWFYFKKRSTPDCRARTGRRSCKIRNRRTEIWGAFPVTPRT